MNWSLTSMEISLDVTVSYDEGYVEQMLRYSKDYSPLPSINN